MEFLNNSFGRPKTFEKDFQRILENFLDAFGDILMGFKEFQRTSELVFWRHFRRPTKDLSYSPKKIFKSEIYQANLGEFRESSEKTKSE